MNKSLRIIAALSAFLLASANALAAPNVVVGTNSIGAGQAAVITMSFQADGTVTSFDFKYTFDNTQFTATPSCVGFLDTTGSANANVACSVVGNEVRVLVSGASAFPVPPITAGSQSLGSVSFQSLGGTPAAVYPLAVTETNYFDTNADPVAGTTSTNGSITVLGPVYGSTPAPGALNVGSVQQGGTDPFVNVVINNSAGGTGTTLTGTCSETADPDGVFVVSGTTNFSVPKAGPTNSVTVTCDSAGSIATHTGTMSCSHNGTNTSPQLYNLSCEITAGPQPSFGSSPGVGAINLTPSPVPQGGTNPTQNISVTNNGDPGTTLDGSCALLAGDSAITLTPSGFSLGTASPAAVQQVSCSAAAEGTYNRTVRCTHDGSNGPNSDFPVSCEIGPPPAPKYTSNKALGSTLNFGGTTEQGDPNPTDTVSLTNTGQTNSELDVTCTDSVDSSNKFSVTNGVINNLLPTGGARVVTVTCDASVQGNYTGTLSCDHNDGTTTDPFTYDLDCKIGPPGGAQFNSNPTPASTIQLTPNGAVVEGTNVPTKPLTFFNNADPGDSDLQIICNFDGSSDAEITVAPTVAGQTIAPQGNLPVAFDCDTSTAGNYSATYECFYDLQLNDEPLVAETPVAIDNDGEASYTVTCDVRTPETVVQPSPPSGTTLAKLVQPGGTVNFDVSFNETADEGVDPNDATLNSCEITGTDAAQFAILSPSFPQYIPSGGSVPVQVQGTDNGSKQVYNATLECVYGDTADACELIQLNGEGVAGESCQTASYPLVMTVGGDATFNVTKEFTDGANPTEVTATISCNTGLPIIQSQEISETRDVTFIVQSFDTGEMNCTITENTGAPELDGYTPTYTAGGPGDWDDGSGGCVFTAIDGGDDFTCAIVNDADPVAVEIEKLWVIDGSGGDLLDTHYKLTLHCDAEILDGDKYCHGGYGEGPTSYPMEGGCKKFEGDSSETFTAWVIPEWPSSHCWVDEHVYDDSVEIENGCGDLSISHGEGDSCLITNTVFYEGIPTLSQYGLAILALLMLGVGLVGFRRFV